jgi:hypothetical protein
VPCWERRLTGPVDRTSSGRNTECYDRSRDRSPSTADWIHHPAVGLTCSRVPARGDNLYTPFSDTPATKARRLQR